MIRHYILKGREPVPEPDLLKAAQWFETADRHVAEDTVNGVRVSTVFLGLDHNHIGKGPPILFETMVFGGPTDEEQERYCTWDEAEAGHRRMVERVRARATGPD